MKALWSTKTICCSTVNSLKYTCHIVANIIRIDQKLCVALMDVSILPAWISNADKHLRSHAHLSAGTSHTPNFVHCICILHRVMLTNQALRTHLSFINLLPIRIVTWVSSRDLISKLATSIIIIFMEIMEYNLALIIIQEKSTQLVKFAPCYQHTSITSGSVQANYDLSSMAFGGNKI